MKVQRAPLPSVQNRNELLFTRLTQWLRPFARKPLADKRHAPRFPFGSSIEVHIAGGARFLGIARDLSARGLGAIVYADLKVGDSAIVKYAHPHTPTSVGVVARQATVRARYGSRFGFEFQDAMNFDS